MNFNKPSSASRAVRFLGVWTRSKWCGISVRVALSVWTLKSIASGALRLMRQNWNDLLMLLAWILIVVVAGMIILDHLNTPQVHRSYLTKQCIRVVLPDGAEGSCSSLPDRYELVWVH